MHKNLTSASAQRKRPSWFEQRRNHFVRQVVDDFFLVFGSFQQLYTMYLKCRNSQQYDCADFLSPETEKVREQIWNQLTRMIGTESEKGRLWRLKDLCHLVWPEQEREDAIHGSLIDWLLGSVFHEAMKLKENIYLLNTYGPAAVRMREDSPASAGQALRTSGAFPQLSNMVDVESLIRRIAADVVNQMEQVGFLLGQANFILRMMMPDLAGNTLVVRLLVEEEALVRALWGEPVEELFMDMFSGTAAEGFCSAGRSYLGGQWYGQALAMYERAFDCDRQCDEARVKIIQINKVLQDNSQLKNWGRNKREVTATM